MNIAKYIPNLIGGISRQDTTMRLVNQCQDQVNYISTPSLGLTTRPPLQYKSAFASQDRGAFFTLDRDQNTQHNLWISPAGLTVETLNGEKQTVEYQDTARNYLTLPAGAVPQNSYKILPVADTCFILNRHITTKVNPDSGNARKNQALIHIKQVNHGVTWSVQLESATATYGYSSDTSKTVSTAQVAANLAQKLLSHKEIANNFNIVYASSVIYITRKDNKEFTIGISDTQANTYSSLVTYKIKDFTNLPTIAVDGYTCCISGNSGNTADDYYVKFKADTNSTLTTWTDTGDKVESREKTAYLDPTKINKDTPIKVGTKVSCTNNPSFKTTVTNISYGKWTIITFADRYPTNPGSLTYNTEQKDSQIKLTHGIWEETVKPAIPTEFDNTTMPHALIHDIKNNTWTFRAVSWAKRTCGDEDSAPFPSFIDKPLTTLFLYRNRLGIVAGDTVTMSAAGDLENYFPETAQTLTDADPIDIIASADDYSDILTTVTLQENLIFFSKKRQYVLSTPDTLSPKTAAILPVTSYTCLPDAQTPVIGSKTYFADTDKQSLQIYEYNTDSLTATKEGISITAHVPDLIPYGDKITLTANQTNSILAVYSSASPDTIWLYQFYTSDKQKLQSAWSRQVIGGTIKNIAFRNTELWLEVQRADNTHIVLVMDFAIKNNRTPQNYTPALDNYIETTQETDTIKLPYQPDKTKFKVLIKNNRNQYVPLEQSRYTLTENTLTLDNPYKAIIGETYSRYYEFSQCHYTDTDSDRKTPLVSGRQQIRKWQINYTDTGAFTATVKNTANGTTMNYPCETHINTRQALTNTPQLRSGSYTVPCRARSSQLTVSITSDSIQPETYLSALITLNYTKNIKTI